jgi:hypothetical protein
VFSSSNSEIFESTGAVHGDLLFRRSAVFGCRNARFAGRSWRFAGRRDPRFGIEIQPTTEKGPQFTLTNFSQKTLTAFFVEILSATESNKPSSMGWDAFLQGKPPLEMGATVSANLIHRVCGPIPDKVEVVAGIWEDGEMFGRPDRVNLLIISRRMREDELDQVVSVLERGLKEDWARVQYLDALTTLQKNSYALGARASLQGNNKLDEKPELLQKYVQHQLDSYTQKRDILRQANPHNTIPTTPGAR